MSWFVFYVIIFIVALLLTQALKRYANANDLIDRPDFRRAHHHPVPRAGGVGFVICFLVAIVLLVWADKLSVTLFNALFFGGGSIAIIGLLDDMGYVAISLRLLWHIITSSLALWLLGGPPVLALGSWTLSSGYLTTVLFILYLSWLTNLYNFMDGIDGLAALEAISVCLLMIFIYTICGFYEHIYPLWVLAVAVMGFLIWNFPRAKIFMGDVGSGFLGLIFGLLSLNAASLNSNLFWSWLILLGVFIVDATLTLAWRIAQKKDVRRAHCDHAYQHAAVYYRRHPPITLFITAINCLWLFPLALMVGCDVIDPTIGLCAAYLPLIALAMYFGAGNNNYFLNIVPKN